MNLHALRVFYTVAKLGSFSGAAEALFISQPAVSKALKELEHGLKQQGIHLSLILDQYDRVVWPHTSRGFFQLNREIEDILEQLGLN